MNAWIQSLEADQLRLLSLALIFVGATFSISLKSRQHHIGRAKFLFLVGTIIGATALSSALLPRLYLIFGYRNADAIVAFALLLDFISGWMIGALGQYRSRDAYGKTAKAWMAVVPIANLALWAARPATDRSTVGKEWSPAVPNNELIGLLGLALLIGGNLLPRYLDAQARQGKDPTFSLADTVQLTASAIMSEQNLPQEIYPGYEFTRASSENTILVLRYRFLTEISDIDENALPSSFTSDLVTLCNDPTREILDLGALIKLEYSSKEGLTLFSDVFGKKDCAPRNYLRRLAKAHTLVMRKYVPRHIDSTTTLLSVESFQSAIIYQYIATRRNEAFAARFETNLVPILCRDYWSGLLTHGVQMTFAYSLASGESLFLKTIGRDVCKQFVED